MRLEESAGETPSACRSLTRPISTRVDSIDILALDEALRGLAETKPRHARLVELRFFGGLEVEEAAEILGVSKETAKLDWRFARAWLNRELAGMEP